MPAVKLCSKKILQFLAAGCQLTRVVLYNGRKMVVIVVVVVDVVSCRNFLVIYWRRTSYVLAWKTFNYLIGGHGAVYIGYAYNHSCSSSSMYGLLWLPYVIGQTICIFSSCFFFMVTLCNRADHNIFMLFLLLSFFFSSPNLSGWRLDVYHTLAHGVALVRI